LHTCFFSIRMLCIGRGIWLVRVGFLFLVRFADTQLVFLLRDKRWMVISMGAVDNKMNLTHKLPDDFYDQWFHSDTVSKL
jgi:hypothetical protein